MYVFTVHEPPDAPADHSKGATALRFIRDRFSFAAALFAPFWMLWHGLFLALLGYVAVVAVIAVVVAGLSLHPGWLSLALVALHVIAGFEAAGLRRWTMERRGWRLAGVVSGRSTEECERRFFASWLAGSGQAAPAAQRQPSLEQSAAALPGRPAPPAGHEPWGLTSATPPSTVPPSSVPPSSVPQAAVPPAATPGAARPPVVGPRPAGSPWRSAPWNK